MLNSDYIRTARAKGLSEKKVIYKHVFRNTMIPMVTMMAGVLPSLFGGLTVIGTLLTDLAYMLVDPRVKLEK